MKFKCCTVLRILKILIVTFLNKELQVHLPFLWWYLTSTFQLQSSKLKFLLNQKEQLNIIYSEIKPLKNLVSDKVIYVFQYCPLENKKIGPRGVKHLNQNLALTWEKRGESTNNDQNTTSQFSSNPNDDQLSKVQFIIQDLVSVSQKK